MKKNIFVVCTLVPLIIMALVSCASATVVKDLSLSPGKGDINNVVVVDYIVGTFNSPFRTESDLKYSLIQGSGDKNNGLFEIDGNKLRVKGYSTLSAGNYTVRVQAGSERTGTRNIRAISFYVTGVEDSFIMAATEAPGNTLVQQQSPATPSSTPAAPLPSSAVSTEDDFDITQNAKGTITITGYHGTATNIVIPASIEGIPVTDIAAGVFKYYFRINHPENIAITSVVIPDGITTIGAEAFYGSHLTSVVIPNSVTSIGASAFAGEYSIGNGRYIGRLTSVTISNRITSIADGTFEGNQLTRIIIPDGITSIGNSAFNSNQLSIVVIPNRVTTIGNDAFNNNQLTSVTIGNSVTTIGYGAFANNRLTSVIIPESVTTFVGNTSTGQVGAFANNQLTSIIIPKSVMDIGQETFANNQLTSVTITNSSITFWSTAGDGPFINNPIDTIILPANVDFRTRSYSISGRNNNTVVFPNNFTTFYESQGKRAGTYIWSGRTWSVR